MLILLDHLYGHTLHGRGQAPLRFINDQSLHHDLEGELDLEGLRGTLLIHKALHAADIPASNCLAELERRPVLALLKHLQKLLPCFQGYPWAYRVSHAILGKIQKIPVKLLSHGLTLTDLMAHPVLL